MVERSQYPGPYGEEIYFEDNIALYFSRTSTCATSCHLGSGEERGFHATRGDTADIWWWKAISTNPVDEADDLFWKYATAESPSGIRHDNRAAGGARLNLDSTLLYPYFVPTTPLFRDFIAYTTDAYEPYDPRMDTLPIGSRLPAILVAPTSGDRGDVSARGHWRQGIWTVEFSRRLNTGSSADVRLDSTLSFGVTVFDNAEKRHAFHLKPMRMVID